MSAYSSLILSDAPIRYYRLDDTNTTATNLGSDGINGTYAGTYTQSVTGLLTGDTNKCFNPAGAGGISAAIISGITSDYSVDFWFKPASIVNSALVGHNSSASPFPQTFVFNLGGYAGGSAGKLAFGYGATANGFTAIFGPVCTIGTVYHAVGTYQQSIKTRTLYINGTLFSQGTTAFDPSYNQAGQLLGIGKDAAAGSSFFNGPIDEVSIYNYVLTPQQIEKHYAVGSGLGFLTGISSIRGIASLTF